MTGGDLIKGTARALEAYN